MPLSIHILALASLMTLSLGCTETRQPTEQLRSPRPTLITVSESPSPRAFGKPIGRFHLTYYWVATESKHKRGSQEILDKKCRPIARVNRGFKRRLTLEGSGKLKDGRLVNTAGGCQCGEPCFWVTGETHPWGSGVAQRPLSPFRSVAVDTAHIKIGTALYVAELDGLPMPQVGDMASFVHDGCVVADDRGGNVRGKQIDFFAAERDHYVDVFRDRKLRKVSLYAGGDRCEAADEMTDSRLVAVRSVH